MKNVTIAVLTLFVTSLVAAAFANGCMAVSRTSGTVTHMQDPACCTGKATCTGGLCLAQIQEADCTNDHGTVAATQKIKSAELVKVPEPLIVSEFLLRTMEHYVIARRPSYVCGFVPIAGYADTFARTGRLLI